MEAVRTSETSVDNHFTRQYNPEDNSEHHTRRRENLKSHKTPLIRNLSIRRHSVVVFALRPLYSRGKGSRYTLCTYFIYGLILRRPLSDQDYIALNNRVINARRVGNDLERSGRGMFLRYYTGICLEVLRKTRRKLGQDSLYLCKNLHPAPPKYEAGVLTARPRCSVQFMYETGVDIWQWRCIETP
jgi:hypothetical protein